MPVCFNNIPPPCQTQPFNCPPGGYEEYFYDQDNNFFPVGAYEDSYCPEFQKDAPCDKDCPPMCDYPPHPVFPGGQLPVTIPVPTYPSVGCPPSYRLTAHIEPVMN